MALRFWRGWDSEAADPALEETRWQRTKRDYHKFTTDTIRVSVWYALCNLFIVGFTTYLTWGHKQGAQVVIGLGAFAVGTIAAFMLPLGLLWATAPVRQLHDARQELRAVLAQMPFPKIRYRNVEHGASFSPNSDFADMVLFQPVVTNLEERTISLSFRLTASGAASERPRQYPLPSPESNLVNLEAHHGQAMDFRFRWLGMAFEPNFKQVYEQGPLANGIKLVLHIDEHNSGSSIHISPFDDYPPADGDGI